MPALSRHQADALLVTLPGWQIDAGELVRTFKFEDFRAALRFVIKIGEIAEEAGHHPDIDIRYNKVQLALVSHDAGGITGSDTAMAKEIGEVL